MLVPFHSASAASLVGAFAWQPSSNVSRHVLTPVALAVRSVAGTAAARKARPATMKAWGSAAHRASYGVPTEGVVNRATHASLLLANAARRDAKSAPTFVARLVRNASAVSAAPLRESVAPPVAANFPNAQTPHEFLLCAYCCSLRRHLLQDSRRTMHNGQCCSKPCGNVCCGSGQGCQNGQCIEIICPRGRVTCTSQEGPNTWGAAICCPPNVVCCRGQCCKPGSYASRVHLRGFPMVVIIRPRLYIDRHPVRRVVVSVNKYSKPAKRV